MQTTVFAPSRWSAGLAHIPMKNVAIEDGSRISPDR